jgi:ABC-type transport system involved in multi-copper enzyme maturation permease subunit
MKLWVLALNTLEGFLHSRLILLLALVGAIILMIMMAPMLMMRAKITPENASMVESVALEAIAEAAGFMSGLGSLLAAWAATDALGSELKTGTVLAVMARPVKRWEFLLGKYLGVLLLMGGYVVMMLGVTHVLGWMGGQHIHVNPLLMMAYPLVRYAIYAAIAMLCTTAMGPVVTMAAVMLVSIAGEMTAPNTPDWKPWLMWLKHGLYYALPSMGLLSEERFLSLRHAALHPVKWQELGASLGYGLDYALVVLLLAMWSFHHGTLRRD